MANMGQIYYNRFGLANLDVSQKWDTSEILNKYSTTVLSKYFGKMQSFCANLNLFDLRLVEDHQP